MHLLYRSLAERQFVGNGSGFRGVAGPPPSVGRIALLTTVLKRVAGKRLLFRPLSGTTDAPPSVGIARATKGDVTGSKKSQIGDRKSDFGRRKA
jgi:hypothetical protein